MNAEERAALQQAVGKTISDVEVKGYTTVTLVFTDDTVLRLWAWDEYGRDGVFLSGEWMPGVGPCSEGDAETLERVKGLHNEKQSATSNYRD